MTDGEMNTAVALALGWTWSIDIRFPSSRKKWHSKEDHNKTVWDRDWLTSTNLIQAVDYILPVLEELDLYASLYSPKWDHGTTAFIHDTVGEGDYEVPGSIQGQGSKASEKMAWALCDVFLKFAEKYPSALKEALRRMAA